MEAADIEEMLFLSIQEGLRRVKEHPGQIVDHVLAKWITDLSRIQERLAAENTDVREAEPDVLDTVTSLPKTRARSVLKEERRRVVERLARVDELLEERK